MSRIERKAAIITPYGLWNYGNRLQNYATTQILKEKGFEPVTLVMKNNWAGGKAEDVKLFVGHQLLHAKGTVSDKYRAFRSFDAAIRKKGVGPRYDLSRFEKQFDLFVIGSDQIWNPHSVSFHGCEFAQGINPEKVICISPSFGVESIPEDKRGYYSQGLSRLRNISVREESGREIVKSLIGRDVPVMADPTILTKRDVWDALESGISIPKSPYLVTYFLGSHIANNDDAVAEFAARNGLGVVNLLDKRSMEYYAAAPNDFVKLIANSDAVLTDSFHAAVFALMYGKQLLLFPREGKVDMSSRFATLESLFNVGFVEEPLCDLRVKRATYNHLDFQQAAVYQRSRFSSFFAAALEEAGL